MQGKNRNFKQENGQPILFIELGLRHTKAIEAVITDHGPVVRSCRVDAPCLHEHAGEVRLARYNLRDFLAKHFHRPGEVVVVIDSSVSLRFMDKVPQTTADTIHEHVRQAISKAENIDLSAYFWTVTPLSQSEKKDQEFTASSFEERSVVVSAARLCWLDEVKSRMKESGWTVSRVLFQQACVIRAFQLFGGTALGNETIGLLHLGQTRYSMALLQNGQWISNREAQVRGTDKLKAEIKSYLLGNVVRLRIQVRCLFVSADGSTGADLLVNELKEIGCYARTWNAFRKITIDSNASDREVMLSDGAQFNALVGATLIAADCCLPEREPEEKQSRSVGSFFQMAETYLPRPLKLAACIGLCATSYLCHLNSRATADLAVLQTPLEQKRPGLQIPAGNVERQLADLQTFLSSRRSWAGVVSQIRSIHISGVHLSQVTIADNLVVAEGSAFQSARSAKHWRNSGSMIVEAKNEGGLTALEEFMNAMKANRQIRPLLHKKKPARVLNNIEVVDAASPCMLFTVEYPLQDTAL